MRALFVFPHPDDESFGPAPLLWKLHRTGHEAHLLTLTRGEATSQREKLGISKKEMARIRTEEMQNMAQTLALASLQVLDFPDGTLADSDPLVLENTIAEHANRVAPHVVVTYAVHGISGHPDHLATHAVVKRVWCALRHARAPVAPQRLAFFTLAPAANGDRPAHLKSSPWKRIGIIERCAPEDFEKGHAALACYETYQRVIEAHQPLNQVQEGVCFEVFAEETSYYREGLFENLPATG